MTKIEETLLILIRTFLLFLGGYVMLGWLLVNPEMVRIFPNSPAMVINTAFCFVVSGLWLVLRPRGNLILTPPIYWASLALSSLLFLVPLMALIEIIWNLDLGIDVVSLHKHILDRNPTPGRMAPNTCVAFILVAIATFMSHCKPTRSLKRTLFLIGAAVTFLGASSVLAYVLQLDWLYYAINHNRMAVPTAAGLTLLGVGILIIGHNLLDFARENRQDLRITRVAALIMIILALFSGLAGFITLKQGTDAFLQDLLLQRTKNAVETLTAGLERQIILKDALLSLPVFEKDLQSLPENPNDSSAREHLGKVTQTLFSLGFSGISLTNVKGEAVYSSGTLTEDLTGSFPIKVQGRDILLIWKDGFLLRSEKTVIKEGVVVGTLITEQKLTGFDRLFKQLRYAGNTTDAVLCQRSGDAFDCLPSRFITHAVHYDMFENGAPSYPISHALLGETGTIYANDLRGVPVLAAYSPVGNTGLGLVVKTETVEFYGFVRQRLHIMLGVLALLVIAGIAVLRFRLQPLATRLVQSEKSARLINGVLAQDAERLNRIVSVQNEIALSPFDTSAVLKTIVENVQLLTRASGAVIEMVEGAFLVYRATSGAFADYTDFRLKLSGSLSGYCIGSGETVRCDDTEADARTDKNATRKLNIRSMIVVPLMHEGRTIGVLKTASAETHAFNLKDEQALQLLSPLIGSAIKHQADYDEKQRLLGEKIDAFDALEKTIDFLRTNEGRTRIIIESAYDAFIGMDGNGAVTDWNVQAEKLFGWKREQVLGRRIVDFIVAPSSYAILVDRLELVLSSTYRPEENIRFEIGVIGMGSREFIIEMAVSPIHTSQGVMLAAFLHDVTERKQNEDKLTHLAQYDALTGLPNRALFMDRLGVAALRIGRTQRAMALMFLDLDGFKKINDGFGHQVGDIMLKSFAERLEKIVRATDTVARLAGDEFTIILENIADPERDVQLVAEKILGSMAEPFDASGQKIIMTTSIGITICKAPNQNIDELIKQADSEMYKAKTGGKNQFSLNEIL